MDLISFIMIQFYSGKTLLQFRQGEFTLLQFRQGAQLNHLNQRKPFFKRLVFFIDDFITTMATSIDIARPTLWLNCTDDEPPHLTVIK